MIELEKLRVIEPALSHLSDEALLDIRSQLYALAQLTFDVWMREQSGSNYPLGVVTPPPDSSKIQI